MPVAKTYMNLKQTSAPFIKNGKMYVTVETLSGTLKTVRWYNDREFKRMYPELADTIPKPVVKGCLGFQEGYITIFGEEQEDPDMQEWLTYCKETRLARYWGWYIVSTEEVPSNLPKGLNTYRLRWELVGNEDGSLKEEKEVIEVVKKVKKGLIK